MPALVQTMKLHLHTDHETDTLFYELSCRYAQACDYISQYVFDNGFDLNSNRLQERLYSSVRKNFGLKSQMAVSSFKTVTARYKTVQTQLSQKPYRYKDENDTWQYIPRTLEWLMKPVRFRRPQADLVRGRDYSFVEDGALLSLNTLSGRVRVAFDVPECFRLYFDGSWSFGTGKLVSLCGQWYFHIPVSKELPTPDTDPVSAPAHVVGIDRGLRFLMTTYDESGCTAFFSGKEILGKRDSYAKVRAQLQSKGTKSAKRVLKRLSGRENRWMTDMNHQLSKTLCSEYGPWTLFVIEDITDVSFNEENLNRGNNARRELRSWTFYQLEQFLEYKALAQGSMVLKVPADYTSQRCPKCGRIHKENRKHSTHEYICDACGFRSNDDRVGAMNLYELGTLYVSGDMHPRFGPRKT